MKKTSIKWLDLFQLRYNASESFLKELNNQLREQYESIMGHDFDIKTLMIEPIAETDLSQLPIRGVSYILECCPIKTWYSYATKSYISWAPNDANEGLIDPSRDISGIEMKMKWESIFISEEHMGYRAPQNKYEDIKKYINEKLPFKAKIEKISDLDILLEINSSNSEIEDRLDNILFEFNKLEFGIVHSANLHKTKGDKTTFHIDLGSADINKFFKFLLEQLVRMSKNETTIKSVIIKNI